MRLVENEEFGLDAYREAMRLLEDVGKEFWSDEEYEKTRKVIQQGYVEYLFDRVKLLMDIGKWELAAEYNREALRLADPSYVDNPNDLQKRGRQQNDEIRARKNWDAVCATTRDLIRRPSRAY